MFYPLGAFRSFGVVLIAILIIAQLRDDLTPEGSGGKCQVEAFKVIEFFNKVFNKNPTTDPEMIDTDQDDMSLDSAPPAEPTVSGGDTRRRSGGVEHEIFLPPWGIFDFGIRGSSHHSSKAVVVKRHAMYNAAMNNNNNSKQLKKEESEGGESRGRQSDSRSRDLDDDDMKKPSRVYGYKEKDKGKSSRDEFKQQDRKKMDRSDDFARQPYGKWRKSQTKERNNETDDDGPKRYKHKGNKNMKASRRGDDGSESEEEIQEVEEQGVTTTTTTKQKQMKKRKPWFWSRRYKSVDDEQVEESYFQKRLNKRIGDIEAWKKMIYCKFNHNAAECSGNETSTNTIDFFGKFKKFTKKPKNRSSTAANNATTPASNGTTGFTDGSTTEWTRATTSSFDEGRFNTNGTTMAIPTRGDSTTTAQPTTTNTATTTTGGSTTTTQAPTTTTTQSSTTVTTTQGTTQTTAQSTTSQPTTVTTTTTTTGAPTTTQASTTTTGAPTTTQASTTTLQPTVRANPSQDNLTQQNNRLVPSSSPQPFTLLP